MEAQLALFKSLLSSTLIYGQESWILTERTRSQIQAAEMRVLRRIVGVTRLDRIRNTRIWDAFNLETLLLNTEKTQLRWLGRVHRMGPDRLVKKILLATPDGRPRTRWADQANALICRIGRDPKDAEALAADTTAWRRLVSLLSPRPA